ncbi:hypothetical protein ANN_02159 [Periplaneta americana]|uniref:EF-hand domain-containing protein n=1 Tax=Periplaneta americana TaxID=6978 RepID=A0ABQ8TVM4_PERAM|nr:hypothetical protein ANN_02159 [Periplaneta americana]
MLSADEEVEDEDGLGSPAVRYRPDNLDDITAATKFSKAEIRWVYRAFKQECPSGAINELTFKNIYAKFFPLGALGNNHIQRLHARTLYRHEGDITGKTSMGFLKLDLNNDGVITVDEFINYCSMQCGVFVVHKKALKKMSDNLKQVVVNVLDDEIGSSDQVQSLWSSRRPAHTVANMDRRVASAGNLVQMVYIREHQVTTLWMLMEDAKTIEVFTQDVMFSVKTKACNCQSSGFRRKYASDRVHVSQLPGDLPDLRQRIEAVVATITPDTLIKVWEELAYQLDVCRVTNGALIEHL